MRRYFLGIFVATAVLIGIIGYRQTTPKVQTTNSKLQVVASFYPLYFFTSQVGGEKTQVYNLTPAGAEPHDYEPTARDIAKIENSNMLVLNGGVEPWATNIKDNLQKKGITIITAGEGLLTKQLTGEDETIQDPHVWLSPQIVKKEVEKITQGLISIDQGNKAYYLNNQKNLDTRLDTLDKEYKNGLQNCETRNIVTSHNAFAYLAEAYGLNQVAITGLSPDEEPSAKQLAVVAKFAKDNNIKYIFFESLVSPKLSQTIASEIGAKTLVLDPIEGLSDDDIKQGKDYFSVMRDNLKNLQIALVCNTTKNIL